MATNFKDAQFQDALLRAGSAPRHQQRGLISKLSGDFAASEQARQQRLDALFQNKEFFDKDMGLREKHFGLKKQYFGLAKEAQKFQHGLAEDRLESENRGIYITTAAGIGTGVVSHLLGRQRAEKQLEQTRLQNEHRKRMEANWTQQDRFTEYENYSSEV